MPDKYGYTRFTSNLNHEWYNDIKSDLQSLFIKPYKLLICLLCIILMNIDPTINFNYKKSKYNSNKSNSNNINKENENMDSFFANNRDSLTLYNSQSLTSSSSYNSSYKQCNKQFILNYFGSSSRNMFHTQLLIGVLFGYIMNNRIPILLSIGNIILRSACTYRPKIIPMFVNNVKLTPPNYYGSSYCLLKSTTRTSLPIDIDSSDDEFDDDDDDDITEYLK